MREVGGEPNTNILHHSVLSSELIKSRQQEIVHINNRHNFVIGLSDTEVDI